MKRINSRQKVIKKKTPLITYDRDIVCLTKQFVRKNGTVKIPRSADSLEYLCRNGLKGKIRLVSTMSEEEIMDEIRSVFKRPFNDQEFSFEILQHGGGKFKSLVVPSLSSSFSWTASAVAGGSKSPIYILTRTGIDVSTCMHGIVIMLTGDPFKLFALCSLKMVCQVMKHVVVKKTFLK